MYPLTQLTTSQARKLDGLLFDLDDTLLDDGYLTVAALQALYDLRAAGLHLVGVTGRPGGWGQVLLRQWPIDAIIAENGIVALHRDTGNPDNRQPDSGRIVIFDRLSKEQRKDRQHKLGILVQALQLQFPTLRPSSDASARLCDYSFDIGEFEQVPEALITQIGSLAESLGARVIRSSIHLHVSLDREDKASGSVRALRQLFDVDPTTARYRYAYVGDSGNDAPCFAAFHNSVAVANLSGTMSLLPRYQTTEAKSRGFCELAQHLLNARASLGN